MPSPSPAVAALIVEQLNAGYQQQTVLQQFSIDINHGDIVCLLGPSGCGKTTALKAIAGLQPSHSGRIELFGRVVADGQHNVAPQQRNIGFIFQDYALFPHLSVADNVGYGLKSLNAEQQQQRINDVLKLVELSDYAKRFPHELSGGQQQRIALARALAPQPDLLLMDEPFSNIDSQVKRRMMTELRRLIKRSGVTAIFVTHAKDEAFVFADQTAVMMDGRIQQYATPAQVFNQPANIKVARFMEAGNLCPLSQLATILPDSEQAAEHTSGTAYALLQRHQFEVEKDENGEATVHDVQFNGRGQLLTVTLSSHNSENDADWLIETEDDLSLQPGDRVRLHYLKQPAIIS